MTIPTKPSIRHTQRPRSSREQNYYHNSRLDIGSYGYKVRLIWAFLKMGFVILGSIAVLVIVGALAVQFFRTAMPMSLIAIVIGFAIWLVLKN